VFGTDAGAWTLIAALLGGTLAATSARGQDHHARGGQHLARAVLELALSLLGDAAVPAMLWLAWQHPLVFFAALAVALVLMVGVLTVLLFKFLRSLLGGLKKHFGAAPARA
jgi:hypothetical protein